MGTNSAVHAAAAERYSETANSSILPLPEESQVLPQSLQILDSSDDDSMDVEQEWEYTLFSPVSSDEDTESDAMDVDLWFSESEPEDVDMVDMTSEWQPARNEYCRDSLTNIVATSDIQRYDYFLYAI